MAAQSIDIASKLLNAVYKNRFLSEMTGMVV